MKIGWLALTAALAIWISEPGLAEMSMTGREFLRRCDHELSVCRDEFTAGLKAVHVTKLACPPRLDDNAPITPWIDAMHARIRKTPRLADEDKGKLELWTFMDIYPCPHKQGAPNR